MKCDNPSCKCSETKVERHGKKFCTESCASSKGDRKSVV